jgi:ubiquinone/menaquinone biosynthesis C-methylase UbiE
MSWKLALYVVVLVAAGASGAIVWRFAFFIAPVAWTREPARLAGVLGIRPGMQVADVGAGSGAHAMAIAEVVGHSGVLFATELSPERRRDIESRAGRASARNVRVIAAPSDETGLADSCCDAIYMRAMLHHIDDRQGFATSAARALRPGGRLAVIDFAPGALWFHGADHGIQANEVLDVFGAAGLRLRQRIDDWGGGMFLLVFER